MQHVPRSKAEVFQSGAVTSYEYSTASNDMNLALIKVTGRYPETGFTRNTKVDSLVQVIGGAGLLGTPGGTTVPLAVGDQLHVAVGDAYYFSGTLKLIYAATPRWTPEQTEHVELA